MSTDLHTQGELPALFADWFAARGWTPRPHQKDVIRTVQAGRSCLLVAPTGGGKTLGGFLPSLIDLATQGGALNTTGGHAQGGPRPHALHTLYISPLKALATDVARNLQAPVAEMGLDIRIETRTGDTPVSKRQRQRARPPDILLTTPEQIALFVAQANSAAFFADLKAVIIDEIHALAPSKRGDLLSLGLAALHRWAPESRRIGLSATVHDEAALAQWLAPQDAETGPQQVSIVRGADGADADVEILSSQERIPWAGHTGRHAYEEVYARIRDARTALVFVNTRSQAEMTFQGLWAVNEENLPIALHHGSLSVEQRRKVESAMIAGQLRAVVCTATLDLGIDWGDVDLVVQMGAPKGAARLIQRIGRANHRMDEASRALLAPSNRFEVLECMAAQEAVQASELDGEPWVDGALDVLAQHMMGRACGEPFEDDALFEEVRRAAPYRSLTRDMFDRLLQFVATGGYALERYDRFRRIVKQNGRWRARHPGVAQQHRMNVGAIVEEPMLDVRVVGGRRAAEAPPQPQPLSQAMRPQLNLRRSAGAETARQKAPPRQMRGGKSIGRVEEWYVSQLAPGDTFLFAGQVFRFEGVAETDAYVSRTQAAQPRVPSWQGGKFPLSTFLAKRVRRLIADTDGWERLPDQVRAWLEAQRARSMIPQIDEMLVETFARSGKHYLVAYPFDGRLAHQTLGMLLTRRLERWGKKPLGFVANDYALSVWGMEPLGNVNFNSLFDEDMLGDDLDAWINESPLMKRTFRYCAIISGLLERRRPGAERSGRQITMSTDLIYDVLRTHDPEHVLLQAAWRDAGAGLLDIRRLGAGLKRVQGRIRHADLAKVSPLSVPVMLEIGREAVHGAGQEAILEEAANELVLEAMG